MISKNKLRELVSILEEGVDDLSSELMEIHRLVHAWCDAVDAEIKASYEDLGAAVFDRADAEDALRKAVGR